MSEITGKTKQRMAGIESLRVFAVFTVILIHTEFYEDISTTVYLFVDAFCRFAVPFFFITAGYFYAQSLEHTDPQALYIKYAKRLLVLFLLWTVIYAFLPDDFLWVTLKEGPRTGLLDGALTQFHKTVDRFYSRPVAFFFEGSKPPLWFLVSLTLSAGIVTIFHRMKNETGLLILALALYAVGLLMTPYSQTALGIHLPFAFTARLGPFSGTLFTAAGYFIYRRKLAVSASTALLTALTGYFISIAEIYWLRADFGGPLTQDFLIGTIPFALGMFFLALACKDFGAGTFLPKLGQYALGIYLAHLVMFEVVADFYNRFSRVAWQFVYPLSAFILALAFTALLKKIPGFKVLVS